MLSHILPGTGVRAIVHRGFSGSSRAVWRSAPHPTALAESREYAALIMVGFNGTHANRVDAKGRVSIPAPFRAILRAPATEGACSAMLWPSPSMACIEGWTHEAFTAMAAAIDQFPSFSQEQQYMSFAVHADAQGVESDREGRIAIPERLCQYAGISSDVVFVGMGKNFHIWEPAALEQWRAEVRESLRTRRISLPSLPVPAR